MDAEGVLSRWEDGALVFHSMRVRSLSTLSPWQNKHLSRSRFEPVKIWQVFILPGAEWKGSIPSTVAVGVETVAAGGFKFPG